MSNPSQEGTPLWARPVQENGSSREAAHMREGTVNARHSNDDATGEYSTLTADDDARYLADADPDHDTTALDRVDRDADTEADGVLPGLSPEVTVDGVDLDQDPFDDDLGEQLESRAPRPKITKVTVVLAGALLLVAGFVGGSLSQKHWGTPTSSNPFANLANARGTGAFPGGVGASGAAGFTGRGTGAGTPITGTVKLVDGTTVYVVTSDGTVVVVKTGTTTTVSAASTLSALTAGSSVTVTGQTGSDGSVTASAITKTK